MRAASGTPATPMMPHMLRSVSHAPGNRAEIYLAQPSHRRCDRIVSQSDAEGTVHRADHADALRRDTELAGQHVNRSGTLRRTRDHGAAVGFAEQYLVRRERCAIRG